MFWGYLPEPTWYQLIWIVWRWKHARVSNKNTKKNTMEIRKVVIFTMGKYDCYFPEDSFSACLTGNNFLLEAGRNCRSQVKMGSDGIAESSSFHIKSRFFHQRRVAPPQGCWYPKCKVCLVRDLRSPKDIMILGMLSKLASWEEQLASQISPARVSIHLGGGSFHVEKRQHLKKPSEKKADERLATFFWRYKNWGERNVWRIPIIQVFRRIFIICYTLGWYKVSLPQNNMVILMPKWSHLTGKVGQSKLHPYCWCFRKIWQFASWGCYFMTPFPPWK